MSNSRRIRVLKQKQLTATASISRYIKRFCVTIGATYTILAAVCTIWKILTPDTAGLKLCFAVSAICIFVFGSLDANDKCKKWGLID